METECTYTKDKKHWWTSMSNGKGRWCRYCGYTEAYEEPAGFEKLFMEFMELHNDPANHLENQKQRAEALTAILNYVRGLEHTIEKVRRAIKE